MKNILFPISVVVNIASVIVLTFSINNTEKVTKENTELFEYVDASKSYFQAKEDFETYTKNYDEIDRYKSEYYYLLQKAEERYKIIKETIHNKYY